MRFAAGGASAASDALNTFAANVVEVASNDALARAAESWRRSPALALDTEFIRTRTFYPIEALYQLATESAIYLIDPLAISDRRPLVDLLEDESIVKVMHACSEDLEVFARHLRCTPRPIFDTQIAESFLSVDFSASYAELVRRHCAVSLQKHETRSDWLARPLRAEQLHYAAEDVRYLLPIARHQRGELERADRLAWAQDECAERCRFAPPDPDRYYLEVGGAARCDEASLRRLRALCRWRELRAREKDLPRGRVVKDDELLDLAQRDCPDRDAVFASLSPPAARRYWREVIDVVAAANRDDSETLLAPPKPLGRADQAAAQRMRELAHAQASVLGVAPELLARRRDLEACVRTYRATGRLPPRFLGWRYHSIGAQFESLLADDGGQPR